MKPTAFTATPNTDLAGTEQARGWSNVLPGTQALMALVATAPGQLTGIFERNADF